MNDEDSHQEVELRPVIARLREIEKKCGSMGSRNEEFPLMQERLNSIIKRLEAGEEPSGEPLAYGAIARELFPIAHLFESVGFMSVGKEIIHVERTLQDLAPEAPVPDAHTAGGAAQRTDSKPTAVADRSGVTQETDGEGVDRHVPWPIIGGLVVLLVAMMIAAMMILGVGPFRAEPTVRATAPTEQVETVPTPAPAPTAVPEPARGTPGPSNTLADEIAAARLALYYGDRMGAIDHLSAAALIDRDNTSVLEIADQLVGVLVNDANAAVADARWEEAAQILERARRVAMRFGLTTTSIDRTTRRLAAMERYVIVGPDDTRTIRASAGRRVELRMKNGSQRTGRIEDVAGPDLLLVVESDVGGGIVSYTDEVPLASITSIKILEN
jgi:hypothetical protein